MGGACHYTVGGVNSKQVIEFFRILRVAVVRLPAGAPSSMHANHVLPVVFRSFAPQLIAVAVENDDVTAGGGTTSSYVGRRRRRRPERMKETFAKVMMELTNTGQ